MTRASTTLAISEDRCGPENLQATNSAGESIDGLSRACVGQQWRIATE